MQSCNASIPSCFGLPRSEEANEVRHISAAHKYAATMGWKAKQLGDPAYRLGFDFACHRREEPRAGVLIDGRGQKVPQDSNRRGRGRNITPEAWVTIEKRVIK